MTSTMAMAANGGGYDTPQQTTKITMKEIPFLQHLSPVSLSSSGDSKGSAPEPQKNIRVIANNSSSSKTNNNNGDEGGNGARCYTVAVNESSGFSNENISNIVPHGAFGLTLCEDSSSPDNSSDGSEETRNMTVMKSELTTNSNNHYNKLSSTTTKKPIDNTFIMENSKDQRQRMLGLTSSTYSQQDDTLICTNGIISAEKAGLMMMRITTRRAALNSSSDGADSIKSHTRVKGRDVLVDISSLLLESSSNNSDDDMSSTTIVKTACFVVQPNETAEGQSQNNTHGSWLHVHMMTSRGAMIRFVFSYPTLTPCDSTFASFLYPMSHGTTAASISVGYDQVCFPTPTTVVYTTASMNGVGGSHCLYCIDVGDVPSDGSSTCSIVTRVWSTLHKSIDPSYREPIAEDNDDIVATPGKVRKLEGRHQPSTVARKKARLSLGNVLSSVYTMVVGGDGVNEEYEYNDDEDDLDEIDNDILDTMPPIAAVTSLASTHSNCTSGDGVARVATCHTDGSINIWVAETTRRKFLTNDDDDTASMYRPRLRIPSVQCVNSAAVDILRSSKIILRGQYNLEEHSYQVALYSDTSANLRLLGGKSFNDFDGEDDSEISFGNLTVQDLKLPAGAKDVVDVSWNHGLDLLVLYREDFESLDGTEEEHSSLAMYPSLDDCEDGSCMMSLEAIVPSNLTLKQFGMNHASLSLNLSISEELDRYIDISSVKKDTNDDMEMDDASAGDNTQLEASIDRAGLLAIFQPLGKSRPSALAVYRAMIRLGLIVNTQVTSIDAVYPTTIVSAMRNWKKRDEFGASNPSFGITSLVPRSESPLPSPHNANTDAQRHSNKTSRVSDDEGEDNTSKRSPDSDSNKLKWIRLLSEIRREELQLQDVMAISSVSLSSSSSINLCMRAGMTSMLSLDEAMETTLKNEDEKLMAELDELSLTLLISVMSDHGCRKILSAAETLIYNAASKATPLLSSWSNSNEAADLIIQIGNAGSLALTTMSLTDQQLSLFEKINKSDFGFAEKWLQSPTSLSSKVSDYLAITKTFDTMPNSSQVEESASDTDAQVSATTLISSMVDSTRLLSLSRLIALTGMSQSTPTQLPSNALRSVLYFTALSWAFVQPSSYDKTRTILDEYLTNEMTKVFYSSGVTTALHLADMCIASSSNYLANESSDGIPLQLVSPAHEPRVALRLLAPLVEYPNFALLGNDQKRKEITAECLLAEAVVVAKQYDRDATTTSPKEYWTLASKFLVGSSSESLSAANFNEIFECFKGGRESWLSFKEEPHHEELLYQALSMILQIGDDDHGGADSSTPETDEEIQRLCTMQTVKSLFLPLVLCSEGTSVDQSFIDGNTWRNIPRISMYNFVKTLMKVSNLIYRVSTLDRYLKSGNGQKSLPLCCRVVLEAINDAITSITSPLPPQMSKDMPELSNLCAAAFDTSIRGRLWDESLELCTSNSVTDDKNEKLKNLVLEMVRVGDVGKLVDMGLTSEGDNVDLFGFATKLVEEAAFEQIHDLERCEDYWGCLYTLHASRGNWRQAAEVMDLCGKDIVSNALLKPESYTRTASKKVMDQASLSAHACSHAVSLVEESPRQYIGRFRDTLLTKDDIDHRAIRASTLRELSMDECSPDSISSILMSSSLDTIDILARLGYYEHAITVAAGMSSKRRSNPNGVDVFFDSLRHILCTYLVPEAILGDSSSDEANQLESRCKSVQMRMSSSVCEQETSSASSKVSTSSSHTSMAMSLLSQYTTSYSERCGGLSLSVASAMLDLDENAALPIWLKDLCTFGRLANENNCIFAERNNVNSSIGADPPGLVRLLMSHHKYGDACDVVTAVLSASQASRQSSSNRLPEKGSIDFVPYELIDELWQSIEMIASNKSSYSDDDQKKIQMLLQSRDSMELSLSEHFQSLKTSEDGLQSARTLSKNT